MAISFFFWLRIYIKMCCFFLVIHGIHVVRYNVRMNIEHVLNSFNPLVMSCSGVNIILFFFHLFLPPGKSAFIHIYYEKQNSTIFEELESTTILFEYSFFWIYTQMVRGILVFAVYIYSKWLASTNFFSAQLSIDAYIISNIKCIDTRNTSKIHLTNQ